MSKKYLKEGLGLTRIVEWCNNTFGKKLSGQKFTCSDIQSYIKRGRMPVYLGRNTIELDKEFYEKHDIKIYNIGHPQKL